MTTLRQAAQQALEALGKINKLSVGENAICLPAEIDGAMDALRAALAEPVQEPYGWIGENSGQFIKNVGQGIVNGKALYTAPPQRKPLTEKQIDYWIGSNSTKKALARAIEAAHGIGEKK